MFDVPEERPFEQPCPMCSGEASRDSPAAQALDWGVRVAESEPGMDGFWQAATAAHAYRTADAPSEPALDRHVQDVMDEAVIDRRWDPSLSWDQGDVVAGLRPFIPEGLLFDIGSGHTPVALDDPLEGEGGTPRHIDVWRYWQPVLASLGQASLGDGWEEYRLNPPDEGEESGGGPRCEVKEWRYPYFWRTIPLDGETTASGIGFYYEAEIIFKHDEPNDILCTCCVFRQIMRSNLGGSTFPAEGWRKDQKTNSKKEYGGGRKDGSNRHSDTDTTREAGQYKDDGKSLGFDDKVTKEEPHLYSAFALTYDFIGLVFDRCNQFAFVDARRFLLYRSVFVTKVGEGYRVVDLEGSPRLHKDVPPESAASAWTHESTTHDGQPRPMPGTNMPPPPDEEGTRINERLRKKREGK